MLVDVNTPRPSTLGDRLDEVMRVRGIKALPWSRKAGYSKDYVAVLRSRAAADPNYVMPEKAARQLAAAVNINMEWLRHGTGTMDETAAPDSPRMRFMEALGRFAPELAAAGDLEAARVASVALNKLLGAPVVEEQTTTVFPPTTTSATGTDD